MKIEFTDGEGTLTVEIPRDDVMEIWRKYAPIFEQYSDICFMSTTERVMGDLQIVHVWPYRNHVKLWFTDVRQTHMTNSSYWEAYISIALFDRARYIMRVCACAVVRGAIQGILKNSQEFERCIAEIQQEIVYSRRYPGDANYLVALEQALYMLKQGAST